MNNEGNKDNKALIGFLGNINYDTRCLNLYNSLQKLNYDISFIGFDWLSKDFVSIEGKISVKKLEKKISLLFYLKFIFSLFFQAIKKDFSLCFAEDVYSLPVLYIVSKIKKAKIIYDSRELFGYLAALSEKKAVQKLIYKIEKYFITKVNNILVTGEMDADFIKEHYKVKFVHVLRNLPFYQDNFEVVDVRKKYNIPSDNLLLVYQGVVIRGRGIKTVFDVLKDLEKTTLLVIGDGEYKEYYEKLAKELALKEKVKFVGKIEQKGLLNYTVSADLGICLIENLSLSYYYALPNKLFEYIMAEVPVIVSDLPQMVKIVDKYEVGYVIENKENDILRQLLIYLENNRENLKIIKSNCIKAKKELNWENEFEKIQKQIL